MGAYAHSITAYAVISKWPQGDAKKFIVRQSAAHLADALRRVPIEGSYRDAPLKQPRSIASQGASVESRMGGRGRDASCPAPPAQVPACVFLAPGSYRRSDAIGIRGLAAQSSSDA